VGVWVCGCVGVWVCGCVGVYTKSKTSELSLLRFAKQFPPPLRSKFFYCHVVLFTLWERWHEFRHVLSLFSNVNTIRT
jgi:hypothetical protein